MSDSGWACAVLISASLRLVSADKRADQLVAVLRSDGVSGELVEDLGDLAGNGCAVSIGAQLGRGAQGISEVAGVGRPRDQAQSYSLRGSQPTRGWRSRMRRPDRARVQ